MVISVKEYFYQLENELSSLNKRDKQKIIKKYKSEWKKLSKRNKDDQIILQMMPTISDIKEKELSRCLGKKQDGKYQLNSIINKLVDILVELINDIINIVKNKKDHSSSLQIFLEIIIKIIIALFMFEIIKIPFILLWQLLIVVIDGLFFPFNDSLGWLIKIFLSITYLVSCLGIVLWMFKDSEVKTKMLLKYIIWVIIIIPMILLSFLCYILILASFFLYAKGIAVLGLSLLLIGIGLLLSYITDYIINIMCRHKKISIVSLIISVIFIISGVLFTIDDLAKFDYPNTLESSTINKKYFNKIYELEEDMTFNIYGGSYQFILDADLDDNQIKVYGEYYPNLATIEVNNYEKESGKGIDIFVIPKNKKFKDYLSLYKSIIGDLEKYQIFNYSKLNYGNFKIYANNKTINKLGS